MIFKLFKRSVSEHFDQKGESQLIRITQNSLIKGDLASEDPSPHVKAVLVDK